MIEGHYDAHGWWIGDSRPPGGQWYSVIHDQRVVPLETQNAPDDVNMGIKPDEFDV